MKADLHCHSTSSDGSLSPLQLIDLAKQLKIEGLAITDHDTIAAYKTAIPYAQNKRIKLISGIEFSTSHLDTNVHVLAYAFDLSSKAILKLSDTHKKRRTNRNRVILENLKKIGIKISLEHLNSNMIGRPHIAEAMVNLGYVKSISDAFNLYLGEGKSCYTPGQTPSVEETIDVIHQAKGFAVIAHPHLILNQKVVKSLLSLPFDGIECYYCRFSLEQNRKWLKIAQERDWLITGGSDFHGKNTPKISLGCSWVEEEHFQILYEHFNHL